MGSTTIPNNSMKQKERKEERERKKERKKKTEKRQKREKRKREVCEGGGRRREGFVL